MSGYSDFLRVGGSWSVVFGIVLALTVIIELVVGLVFRLGRRGLIAVALVNLLTNPVFNLTLLLSAFVVGFGNSGLSSYVILLVETMALEVVVVVAEWRLLVWATKGTAGSSRRLLVFCVVANLVSALAPFLFWEFAWLI